MKKILKRIKKYSMSFLMRFKNEGILCRDLLIQAIEETTQNNGKWSPSV